MIKNDGAKLLLGLVTLWPILYMAFFFMIIFSGFTHSGTPFGSLNNIFSTLFVLHGVTMLLSIILLLVYITDIFKNPAITSDKRTLWAVVIFFGSFLAMPIYWYLYIWSKPSKRSR